MRTLAVLTLVSAVALAAQAPPDAPILHIQAELQAAVKLNKAKVGDKLKAKTAADVTLANGTAIPAGALLLGQVLAVDASSVTIAFDQANADGKKIPLNITLVAAALMGGSSGGTSQDAPAKNEVKPGAGAPAHPGSVVGMPGVTLRIDDGPPYASKFEIKTKDQQLPKGVQLMFSVR
jgi:hypothetical protein